MKNAGGAGGAAGSSSPHPVVPAINSAISIKPIFFMVGVLPLVPAAEQVDAPFHVDDGVAAKKPRLFYKNKYSYV